MKLLNGLNNEKALKILSISALISCLAAVMYSFFMAFNAGFSVDEVYTIMCTNPARSAGQLWDMCMQRDANPPFYIWFIYAYHHLAYVHSEFWVRLPSLFAWMATIGLSIFFFPVRYGKYVKWSFIGFLTCSAYLCLIMVQARSYSISVLISFFITFWALDFFEALHSGAELNRKKLIAFFAVSLLGCYAHYFCAVIFVITTVLLIAVTLHKKRSIKWLLGGLLGVLALYCFWIGPSLFMQKTMGMFAGQWDSTSAEKWRASTDLFKMAFNMWYTQLFAFVFVAGSLLSLKKDEKFNYWDLLYPALLFLLTFLSIMIISLKINLMVSRYFLVLLPAIYFVCALGVGKLLESYPKTVIIWLLFLVLCGGSSMHFFKQSLPFTMRMKAFAQEYMAKANDKQLLLVSSYQFTPLVMEDLFSWYLKEYYKQPVNVTDIRKLDLDSIKLLLNQKGALIYVPTCDNPVLDSIYQLTTTRIMFYNGKNNYCLLKVV